MSLKISFIYHSLSGNVHQLAVTGYEHAKSLGHDVTIHRLSEIEEDPAVIRDVHEKALADLEHADIVLWGTPARYGSMSSPMKYFIDQTLPLHIEKKLANKYMTTFVSSASNRGGQESTILAFNNVFYHWGAIIVPAGLLSEDQNSPLNATPYGISSVSFRQPNAVPEENLAAIRYIVERIINVKKGA